ncbi:hypothetical protein HMPREF1983_00867 [Gemella bergeri ATCC 700627]|uniref:Uncharacterized protein n=1 Tax=Gemella bergeri ATCC 700627 TaxID=1321820 RepID=U2RWV2_9BACL|nr:hypothetical protein HMPREF1983_00867 [Gemella bergeri ATCC 700627]
MIISCINEDIKYCVNKRITIYYKYICIIDCCIVVMFLQKY